jgi:hypothetical protein
VDADALTLSRGGARAAVLALAPSWAHGHPRTLHLLRAEADAWKRHGALAVTLRA